VCVATPAVPLVFASSQNGSPRANSEGKPETAKSSAGTPKANEPSFRPGSGTIIVIELTKGLNAKKVATGERVDAIVTQDLLYQGKVIIPSNVKVLGHVTEVKASDKEDPESRLGMVFDKIILRDGREMPFQRPAIVEALAPQMRLVRTANQNVADLPIKMQRGQASGDSVTQAVGPETRINGGTNITATGALSQGARGVIGIKGLALNSPYPETSVITSSKGDVKLDYGTQMVLRVTNAIKP
jgi:hypothetical protein